MDIESAESVHSFELAKAVERHFGGTSNELEKLGSFFFIEGTDCAPEPLDLS